jgi:hypothetical protein
VPLAMQRISLTGSGPARVALLGIARAHHAQEFSTIPSSGQRHATSPERTGRFAAARIAVGTDVIWRFRHG